MMIRSKGVIKHCMEKYIHRFGIRLNGVIASNSRKDNSSGRLGVYNRRFIPNTNLYDSSRLGGYITDGNRPCANTSLRLSTMERVKKSVNLLIEKKRRTNQPEDGLELKGLMYSVKASTRMMQHWLYGHMNVTMQCMIS